MEMEKQKMEMFFLVNEDEKQDTYFDPTELKAHLKIFPPFPTKWKTQSEGFWEVKKPCQWTRP